MQFLARLAGWGRGRGGKLDSSGSGYEPLAGCCERGDELWGSGARELDRMMQYYKNVCECRTKHIRTSGLHDFIPTSIRPI
jgi:hypothetical protein